MHERVLVLDFTYRSKYGIDDLLKIMIILRSEEGCPWDREQTHESIRMNFIEETYEVCEAIDNADKELLKEELGDVLLQVVFHACIEQESGAFDFSDVCDGICKKLIERHPHVFSNVKVDGSEQVLVNWENIKRESKGQKTHAQSVKSVPKTLPALMRAQKVQQRAAKSGFDYRDMTGALDDLQSEISEFKAALCRNDEQNIREELGDILFSAVNVSRFAGVNSELALSEATDKFASRFAKVEAQAVKNGVDLKSADEKTLDKLWTDAKQ